MVPSPPAHRTPPRTLDKGSSEAWIDISDAPEGGGTGGTIFILSLAPPYRDVSLGLTERSRGGEGGKGAVRGCRATRDAVRVEECEREETRLRIKGYREHAEVNDGGEAREAL